MKVTQTELNGVVILEPRNFPDERGSFMVTYTENDFSGVLGVEFVQDNQSVSKYGVIRGLHYQLPPVPQAKLVRAVTGRILDIAVDIRRDSPTFGRYVAVELSGENNRQLFIPEGFAHGFSVLSEEAVVLYKCNNYYSPENERGIAFDDPWLNIDWKVPVGQILLSDKDRKHPVLKDAEIFE